MASIKSKSLSFTKYIQYYARVGESLYSRLEGLGINHKVVQQLMVHVT